MVHDTEKLSMSKPTCICTGTSTNPYNCIKENEFNKTNHQDLGHPKLAPIYIHSKAHAYAWQCGTAGPQILKHLTLVFKMNPKPQT